MSVFIKGMKMPLDCGECGACIDTDRNSYYCGFDPIARDIPNIFAEKRPEWCPLIETDSDKSQWVPVGKSVPDTSKNVLVTFKNGTVGKAWYNGTLWASNTSRCLTTVIAWCELPKPYSESEDK